MHHGVMRAAGNAAMRAFRMGPVSAVDAHPPGRARHGRPAQLLWHVVTEHERPPMPLGARPIAAGTDEFAELLVGRRKLRHVEWAEGDQPHRTLAIGLYSSREFAAHAEAPTLQPHHVFERPGSGARPLEGHLHGRLQFCQAGNTRNTARVRRCGSHLRQWRLALRARSGSGPGRAVWQSRAGTPGAGSAA